MALESTVTVSVELLVWIGSLFIAGIGAFLSFATHLLIAIRSTLSKLVTDMAVKGTKTDSRLDTLERHDLLNAKERAEYISHLMKEQHS